MKIGLFTTNQQHVDADMVGALEEQYAMVRLARDRGWDSLFTGQHYLNEGNNKQLQIVPFLSRLMAEAGEMTVGMGIMLLTLHNPVLRGGDSRINGHPGAGKFRVRGRIGLPRGGIRRLWGAQRPACQTV